MLATMGSIYAEASRDNFGSVVALVDTMNNSYLGGVGMYANTAGGIRFQVASDDSAVQVDFSVAGSAVVDTVGKYASRWATNAARAYVNGTTGTPDTTVTVPSSIRSVIAIGERPAGSIPLFGTIRNVKIWKKALTDTQLTNMTSTDPDVSAGAIQQTVVNDSQNTKMTNGLVGLWSLDGPDVSDMTTYDRSGQNHNGTLTNGPSVTPGQIGQAIRFDGTDDYIAIGTGYNGVKTVSFWVKPNSTTQSIIDFNGTQTVDISAGTVRGNSFTSPTIYVDGTATSTFPDTDWHFVTITTDTAINASAFNIGKIASAYLSGAIDEVRLYDRVLSVSEISGLYNLGR